MRKLLKLRVLLVEDSADDAEILLNEVGKGGYDCNWKRIADPANLAEHLQSETWDIVFCDYNMPGFSGPEAIRIIRQINPDIPVILISGEVGEEVAVEAMRTGADDYLLKGNLTRLIPVIKRELREYRKRIELNGTQKQLELQTRLNRVILDHMPAMAMLITKGTYEIVAANQQAARYGAGPGARCHKSLYGYARPCPDCKYPEMISSGKEQSDEKTHEGKVSERYWIDVNEELFLHFTFDITERRKVEKEIRESEQKFRTLFEGAAEGILVADLETREFIYANPAICSMLGYSNEELLRLGVHDIHPEGALRKVLDEFETQSLGKENLVRNIPCVRKDGSRIHTDINTSRALINGRPCNVGFFTDITELCNAQKESEEQHILLRTLIDNIPDYIYVKDSESRFILNNLAHRLQLGGASQEELKGKSDADYFSDEFSSNYMKGEQEVLETGKPVINREEVTSDANGDPQWLLTTKVPLFDREGRISGIAGIGRDITQLKQAEMEILRNHDRLESLLKISMMQDAGQYEILDLALTEGISLTGSKIGYIYLYDEATGRLSLNNWSEEAMKECTVAVKQTSYKLEKTGLWGEAVRQRKPVITNDYEAPNQLKKGIPVGHVRLKRHMNFPVFYDGKIVAVMGVANKDQDYSDTDLIQLQLLMDTLWKILDRSRQQEEITKARLKAEESDRLKSAFLMNLSHEIRTPMNAIIGFSDLLTGNMGENGRTAEFVSYIKSAGLDLLKMVDDTVDMAKLENGQIDLLPDNKDIVTTIREIYDDFQMRFKVRSKDIRFKINTDMDSMMVRTDHAKLKQVVSRLLDNAFKFTEKGEIELGIQSDGNGKIVVFVRDTGIGIPEEMQEAIFDKFTRVENTDILFRGNGLGLSISRGLTALLGGTIEVESGYRKGSTFRICLSLTEERPVLKS